MMSTRYHYLLLFVLILSSCTSTHSSTISPSYTHSLVNCTSYNGTQNETQNYINLYQNTSRYSQMHCSDNICIVIKVCDILWEGK
jgi:hypothetical protein